MDQRKNNFDENGHRPKQKKNGTLTALAVISSLFIGVLGFEAIRYNLASDNTPGSIYKPKKSSVLVGKSSYASSQSTGSFDGEEDYQLHILREQNNQQAAKIKSLRRELMERMQSVQDIKANLFKYDKDSGDRALISELQKELALKHQHGEQLKLKMAALELESTELVKKITQLEVTRDTLTTIIDNQKVALGQEAANLKSQFSDIQNILIGSKSDLERKSQMLELAQQHLIESLENKSAALNDLEKELAQNQIYISDQSDLLQLLYQHLNRAEEMALSERLSLATNIEFENTLKEIDKRDFLTALEEKTALITLLENEIASQQEEIVSQGVLLTHQESQANLRARNFILALDLESLRAQQLHEEHTKVIHMHLNELLSKSEIISQLEEAIQEKSSEVRSVDEKLLALTDTFIYERQQSEDWLRNAATSHDLETTRTMIAGKHLNNANITIEDLEKQQQELLANATISLERNEELRHQLSSRELQLANYEMQLRLLTDIHSDGKKDAVSAAGNLTGLIEVERLQNAALVKELEEAQQKYLAQQDIAQLLGSHLETIAQESTQLETALADSKQLLLQAENELKKETFISLDHQDILTHQIAVQEFQLADHLMQLEMLKKSHGEGQLLAEEAASKLAEAIETERSQSQSLTLELAEMQKIVSDKELHAKELAIRLEEMTSESEELKAALLDSKGHLEKVQEELKSELQVSLQYHEQLAQQLEAKTLQLSAYEEDLRRVSSSHESNHKQYEENTRRLADIIEAERLQSQALAQDYQSKLSEVEFLESDLVLQLQKMHELESQLGAVRGQFETEVADKNSLKSELESLKLTHSSLKEEASFLKNDLSHFTSNTGSLQEELENAYKLLAEQKIELHKTSEERKDIEKNLMEYLDLHQTSASDNAELNRFVENLNSALDSLTKENEQLQQVQTKIEGLQAQLQHEKEALDLEREEKQFLIAELNSAHEKLERLYKMLPESN